MKTLIVYATKYGAAGKAAGLLAQSLPGAEAVPLKKGAPPPEVQGFDAVVLVSAVYAGTLRSEAKAFCLAREAELAGKPYALLLCQSSPPGTVDETLRANLPLPLVEGAKLTGSVGGLLQNEKLGFFDRLIFNAVAKSRGGATPQLDEAAIAGFARQLQA